MRFVRPDGGLDLVNKDKPNLSGDYQNASTLPWFKLASRVKARQVFGHWAALEGDTGLAEVINLDMGCVWGGQLKLMRLDDGQCFSVSCS
jgi:bis(5'-nucleosyl)-tetraphosphatase (symmetrical)